MANNRRSNKEIEFKVISSIGTLATYQSGWSKELNIIAWNGGAPKYDIRDWDPDHEHMSKGITLHEEEARNLMQMLASCFTWGYKAGNKVETPAFGNAEDTAEELCAEEFELGTGMEADEDREPDADEILSGDAIDEEEQAAYA